MFLRCNWVGTNKLFFKEGPLHQIEVGVFHSFQDTGVCRAFDMMSALLRRRVISLLISSDQINAQVDHPIMIHLATSVLQLSLIHI